MEGQLELVVVNGALLQVPVYETHPRGSNWMAVIGIDPTAPGGLSRQWLPRAKGGGYIVVNAEVYDPIEFGADYKTFHGDKHPKRWYGVILVKRIDLIEAGKGTLIVKQCDSGRNAVLESIRLKETLA